MPFARRWRNARANAYRSTGRTTQNNLGNALVALGERETGTARLEEAVAAYRAALEELTASGCRSIGRRHRTISAMRY